MAPTDVIRLLQAIGELMALATPPLAAATSLATALLGRHTLRQRKAAQAEQEAARQREEALRARIAYLEARLTALGEGEIDPPIW